MGVNASKKRSIQSRETVVNHSELIVPLERADVLCAFTQPTRALLAKLALFHYSTVHKSMSYKSVSHLLGNTLV